MTVPDVCSGRETRRFIATSAARWRNDTTAGGRQILFRDIMPDNIILTSGREVRYEHDAASYIKQQERGDRVSLCMGALFFFRSPATL